MRREQYVCAFIVLLLATTTVLAQTYEEGAHFRVNSGTTRYIHTAQGTYIGVTNNSGNDILVPNQTAAEINAFLAHKPSQVTTCSGGNWTPVSSWSNCTKTCGGGEQYKEHQCTGSTCGGGCPETKPARLVQSCNTQACPVVTVTGVIKVVGSAPFTNLIINAGGTEYKIVGSLYNTLRNHYQNQTVTLRGSVTDPGSPPFFPPTLNATHIL